MHENYPIKDVTLKKHKYHLRLIRFGKATSHLGQRPVSRQIGPAVH